MRKFEFKLSKVERVREIEMDLSAREHALKKQFRLGKERELADRREDLDRIYRSARFFEGERLSITDLENLDMNAHSTRRKIGLAKVELSAAVKIEESARLDLLEKVKRKKVVAVFRERKHAEYLKEQERAIQKELDDSALQKYARKGAENRNEM